VDLGSFTSGLVTGLREGVEAALIVAIILAYLARTGNGQHAAKVWLGTAAAAAVSLALGLILFNTVGGLQEPYEQLFEGITMLLAAGVVTWMLFWMRRQAAGVKGELQKAVDRALDSGGVFALVVLAFTAIIREGVETSLFLVGLAQSAQADAPILLLGALVGLAIAVLIGVGFYQGSRRVNLATFFRWTGVALVFIAAGLLSHAVHEFIEVAEFNGVELVGSQVLFDISRVLPHEEGVGAFLRALFGYTSQPELLTFAVWLTYVVVVLALYLRPVRRATPPPTPVEPPRSTTEAARP
jgi:high-affinity iron transporter